MFKVNLFIVGAPKCGTTALSNYLSTHPNIKVSTPKEPYFFCQDFKVLTTQPQYAWKDIEHYHESCFKSVNDEHKVICDATVWNLYSKVAGKKIVAYNPEAKFIVMLRNPVGMIYSLHSMYVGLGFEDIRDFQKAFFLQEQRSQGKYLPKGSLNKLDPELLLYGEVGLLGQQLKRFYDMVPQENVKVIFFDDFSKNPLDIYLDVIDFLNIPYDGKKDFSLINAQKKISSPLLINLSQSQMIRKFSEYVKQLVGIKSFGFGIAKPPMISEVKALLVDYYKEDIALLSDLTKRSLEHWVTD